MLPPKTRKYLVKKLKTMTPNRIVSLREETLTLFREALGFAPAMRYDDQTAELVNVLASLTAEELQTVVKSAKAMRKDADPQARQIWRRACTNES